MSFVTRPTLYVASDPIKVPGCFVFRLCTIWLKIKRRKKKEKMLSKKLPSWGFIITVTGAVVIESQCQYLLVLVWPVLLPVYLQKLLL